MGALTLVDNLALSRCPHCAVANPNLFLKNHVETNSHSKDFPRFWDVYACATCGGVVTAWANRPAQPVIQFFPEAKQVDADIPERARSYLQQAHESLHAAAGAVMLAASAVDALLKEKGYNTGTLYARIEKAANDHVLTPEMTVWAHSVRLDANDQRHVDEAATLPSEEDAKRVLNFANALAEFLFVLPSRIERGLHPPETTR